MNHNDGYLRHIHACTNHDPKQFRPFVVAGRSIGWVRHDVLPILEAQDGFVCADGVMLRPSTDDEQGRTVVLQRAARRIAAFHRLFLHGEVYPVYGRWGDEPLARIDRAALPWFGVRGCGVHVNGYVRKKDGLYLWIGERSLTCRVDPGKLDLMIGGGLPYGLTIQENLRKEAWEEAGIDASLADHAQHVSTLSYMVDMMKGLRNDTLFSHDLELPESFEPCNTDGEVGRFHLLPATEVAHIIRTTNRFKFNCNLVLIDALLHHGIITPDDQEYEAVLQAIEPVRSI